MDLEKSNITLLAHQWILCSEWVPTEWESKLVLSKVLTSIPFGTEILKTSISR